MSLDRHAPRDPECAWRRRPRRCPCPARSTVRRQSSEAEPIPRPRQAVQATAVVRSPRLWRCWANASRKAFAHALGALAGEAREVPAGREQQQPVQLTGREHLVQGQGAIHLGVHGLCEIGSAVVPASSAPASTPAACTTCRAPAADRAVPRAEIVGRAGCGDVDRRPPAPIRHHAPPGTGWCEWALARRSQDAVLGGDHRCADNEHDAACPQVGQSGGDADTQGAGAAGDQVGAGRRAGQGGPLGRWVRPGSGVRSARYRRGPTYDILAAE